MRKTSLLEDQYQTFYQKHHRIQVMGVDVVYLDTGTCQPWQEDDARRPIVIALHGFATCGYMYRHWIQKLSQSARIMVPDIPPYGESGKVLSWKPSYPNYAQWLDAFIDLVVPANRQFYFVAQDWSVPLAVSWAARHPQRLKGLLLFSPFLHPERSFLLPGFFASSVPFLGSFALETLFNRPDIIERIFDICTKRNLDATAQHIYMMPFNSKEGRKTIAHHASLLIRHPMFWIKLWRRLGHLDMPVSLIFGAERDFMLPKDVPKLAKQFHNVSYRSLPGVGFLPVEEAADACISEMLSMIALEKIG
ncbi:MAG: alpha/beta fold hydrolase [Pseudomonadota bacterium]